MVQEILIDSEVDNQSNLRNMFSEIRAEIDKADSSYKLDGIYYRAGYVIVLVNDAVWEKKFADDIEPMRSIAEAEFRETARKINTHAEKLGMKGNYDEVWAD